MLFSKSKLLPSLFKKSDRAKSGGSDLLLGIKMGKAVKTVKNIVKTTNLFEQIPHVTLC